MLCLLYVELTEGHSCCSFMIMAHTALTGCYFAVNRILKEITANTKTVDLQDGDMTAEALCTKGVCVI